MRLVVISVIRFFTSDPGWSMLGLVPVEVHWVSALLCELAGWCRLVYRTKSSQRKIFSTCADVFGASSSKTHTLLFHLHLHMWAEAGCAALEASLGKLQQGEHSDRSVK